MHSQPKGKVLLCQLAQKPREVKPTGHCEHWDTLDGRVAIKGKKG